MEKTEIDEIIEELTSAGPVLKLAIKVYKSMPEGKDKEDLKFCIKEAKTQLQKLDVILEDVQMDLEAIEVEKELDKMKSIRYN